MMTIGLWLAVTVAVVGALHALVSSKVPEPYMDEQFHCPQALFYCNGQFDVWDPMITTFPGTYLHSTAMANLVTRVAKWLGAEWLSDINFVCSPVGLRIINSLFTPAIIWVAFRIRQRLYPKENAWTQALSATLVAWMPVLFFFNALYYTDLGSVFYVLLSYLLLVENRPMLSGIAGAAAVLFRQTNIVWVAWVAGMDVLQQADQRKVFDGCSNAVTSALQLLRNVPALALPILSRLWLHIGLGVAFVAFVIHNEGSLVLGDKTAHQTVVHGAQPFYCAAFIALAVSPTLVLDGHIQSFISALPCMKRAWRVVPFAALVVTAAVAMAFSALDHPYLLSDNRHFTFYIWKRLLSHQQLRMVLSPLFGFAPAILTVILPDSKSHLLNVLFFAATTIVLVPAHLLEFRYFLIPYALFRVRMVPSSKRALLLEGAAYVLVNAMVLFLFLERPFRWPDSADEQRFMW